MYRGRRLEAWGLLSSIVFFSVLTFNIEVSGSIKQNPPGPHLSCLIIPDLIQYTKQNHIIAFAPELYEKKFSRLQLIRDMYVGTLQGFGNVNTQKQIENTFGLAPGPSTDIKGIVQRIPDEQILLQSQKILESPVADCSDFNALYEDLYLKGVNALSKALPIAAGELIDPKHRQIFDDLLSDFVNTEDLKERAKVAQALIAQMQPSSSLPLNQEDKIRLRLQGAALTAMNLVMTSSMPMDHAMKAAVYDLERFQVWKISKSQIPRSMMKGVMNTLDAHTELSAPVPTSGTAGLGVGVTAYPSGVYVTAVMPGGTAEKEGLLQPGDVIVATDDVAPHRRRIRKRKNHKDLGDYSFSQRIEILKGGPPGSKLKVQLIRTQGDDAGKTLDFTVTRGHLPAPPAQNVVDLAPVTFDSKSFAVLKVRGFGQNMTNGVRSQIRQVFKNNFDVDGVVLDLRSNPGGYITEAANLQSLFLNNKPTTILNTIESGERQFQVYQSQSPESYENLPMVILVDERSASASELLSIALQDFQRAIVVGRRSYGKGTAYVPGSVTAMTGIPFTTERLKITNSYYYSPGGRSIHGRGVSPDVVLHTDFGFKRSGDRFQESDPNFLGLLSNLAPDEYEMFEASDEASPLTYNPETVVAEGRQTGDLSQGSYFAMVEKLKDLSKKRLNTDGLNFENLAPTIFNEATKPNALAELNEGLAVLADQVDFLSNQSGNDGDAP